MVSSDSRRTLGILGGMGPAATARFYMDLVKSTPARNDQEHPHVIVDSDPGIPDRTDFLLGRGPDPRTRLRASATRLRDMGVGLIVMPCNTASAFIDDLAGAVSVPFINWIEEAAKSLSSDFEPPVGVLATSGTIQTGLYQQALTNLGLNHITPDERTQAEVMEAVYGDHGLKTLGRSTRAARSSLISAAHGLADRGAKGLVLGCTELPLVLEPEGSEWPLPVADPAKAAIKTALTWLGKGRRA